MSKKTFQEFLNENDDVFNFHSIDKLQVTYRSENVEIKGTLDSRSLLGKTATAWKLFNELEGGSIVATITIPEIPDGSSEKIYDK